MKARSKPPKPSRSFTQNKFGSHSNDPSSQRSQNLPPHRHTHTIGPLQILCSSNQIIIKSRNVTFFAIFWKRFSSGGGRGAKGCHRCYILAPPWRGRTRTHFTSCTMCTTSLSLTYHRPEQSRPWSLSVLQLSWCVLFNDSLNQTFWRSTKNSIYYTQNNRDRTCLLIRNINRLWLIFNI